MKQLVLISTLLLGLSGQAFALPIISLNPNTSSVIPGQYFFIDVNVSGLLSGGTNSLLGAFSMDVLFDPNIVRLDILGSYLGNSLGDLFAAEAIADGVEGSGIFSFYEISWLEDSAGNCILCTGPYLEDLQGDSFTLATLAFYSPTDAIASGPTTTFSTANVLLSDAFGDEIPSVSNPSVTISVPEPPIFSLLGIGLALLGYRNQKPVLKNETKN